jgi:hypothetical protein
MILFKKQLFVFEAKGQSPTKVIMVCDTPPYGHAPTYQISIINDLPTRLGKQIVCIEIPILLIRSP